MWFDKQHPQSCGVKKCLTSHPSIRTEKASQERIQVFRAVSKHKIVDSRYSKLFLYPFQCTRMYVCFLLVFNGKLHFPQNLKILNELWQLVFEVIPVKLGTSWFYYLTLFMISRPLWATYIVTPEQKSSGILISELFEVRKWVEKNSIA